jgi:hypothetical protein
VGAGPGWGSPLNFFGEADAAVRLSPNEKVQDVTTPTRVPNTRVVIALLPRGTDVGQLAKIPGISPGLLSAGLGSVPAAQTYLDASQGNRVFDSLYDSGLPRHVGGGMCGPRYSRAVVERAESAPADIVPGLLAATLRGAGRGCRVRSLGLRQLSALVRGLRGNDLVVAFERPPPARDGALAVGIAGRGFDGSLTSDSTRTEGYVLSTDIAPTILERFGIAVPAAMPGQAIRSEGRVDVGAIESLGARMSVISERRGPVIGLSLAIWLAAMGLVMALSRGRAVRTAVELTGLSIVYLPLLLLAGAGFEPSQAAERLLVAVGAPLLAAVTLALLRGYRALAVASGLVVGAYAIDVIAGSPLTSLSLLGPNPGLGVRFYGIGNELEAILAVLTIAGTGAWLAAIAPRAPRSAGAFVFLAAGLAAAAIFAAGRFGADVGAAIVLPIGAAVAAAVQSGQGRRGWLLVIGAPLALLALVALADLISGANAHLTRSVLDAGGLGSLADVAQRRLQLSAHSFARPIVFLFLPLIAAIAAVAIARRDRLERFLEPVPAMRAGLLGALAATLVGTLANDSGALLLEIGSAYLLVFFAFAWAQATATNRPKPTR